MDSKLEKYSVPSDSSEEELDQLFRKCYLNSSFASPIDMKGFILSENYSKFEKNINKYEIFDSDIWICGFPKSGTNWISEIVWLISHDLNYEGAKVSFRERWSNLDLCFLYTDGILAMDRYGSAFAEKIYDCKPPLQTNPRLIKSHLPFPLVPEGIRNGRGKVIYIARNPMDVCVSFYHHAANINQYSGTLDDFCKLFLYGKVYYGPHAKHVLSFWDQRNKPNLLFITYEEMKKDLPKALRTVAQFLGKKLSEEDCSKLQEYVSFESMKKNPAVNREDLIKKVEKDGRKITSPFIRKGKVGGYKTEMSPNYISLFEYWMPKLFEGSGLKLCEF